MNKEQIFQVQIMEQEVNQLNQQLQLIEQNITEMREIKLSLEEIEKTKENHILANLGKGIYIPVEIKDKQLIVEVGKGNFVKKNISETKQIIDEQIKKLSFGKNDILNRLQNLQKEINSLMLEIQKTMKKNS